MQTVTVLVADDHEAFRTGLVEFLNNQRGFKVIGEAKDGLEAISLTQLLHPDLVAIDISMPRLDGLSAVREIKESSPKTKIVVVTIHEEKTYRAVAEAMHVDGFVCKGSIGRELPKILHDIRWRGRGRRERSVTTH